MIDAAEVSGDLTRAQDRSVALMSLQHGADLVSKAPKALGGGNDSTESVVGKRVTVIEC